MLRCFLVPPNINIYLIKMRKYIFDLIINNIILQLKLKEFNYDYEYDTFIF